MDLNFCTVCSQETSGELYCSETCRYQDLCAAIEEDFTAPSPDPMFDTFHRSRASSSGSSSSSSEEEPDREHFVLPGRRNVEVAVLGGELFAPKKAAPTASRKLASRAQPRLPVPPRRPLHPGRSSALDSEDPEQDFLSRILHTRGFDHRPHSSPLF